MSVSEFVSQVKFDDQGLVLAIVQDYQSQAVLMAAYMNRDTVQETLESGKMVYWSRSRQKRWVKGETSGNVQNVKQVRIDCDGDALLFLVEQVGDAACHTGHMSCFYRVWNGSALEVHGKPVFDPGEKYGKK